MVAVVVVVAAVMAAAAQLMLSLSLLSSSLSSLLLLLWLLLSSMLLVSTAVMFKVLGCSSDSTASAFASAVCGSPGNSKRALSRSDELPASLNPEILCPS